jgi:hypothetical protein
VVRLEPAVVGIAAFLRFSKCDHGLPFLVCGLINNVSNVVGTTARQLLAFDGIIQII